MQTRPLHFRHMRIKNKLSLLIASIVAITFTIALIVQQYAFSVYDEQLYQKSSTVLHLSSSVIEQELQRIEQLSFNIITDAQIQTHLRTIADSESEYDMLIQRQRLADRLLYYVGSEPSLHSIHIIDAHGKRQNLGRVIPISENKISSMLIQAGEGSGQERWTYPDASDPALILTRDIRSYSGTLFDLERIGTIFIRIDMDRLVHQFTSQEGDLMMISGHDVIYPRLPQVNPAEIPSSFFKNDNHGYFIREWEGKSYFTAYRKSAETGWTYINITPFNEIFKRVLFIKSLVIYVFIFIFAVAILWGVRFSRSLTKPIENLMARMKLAEKGNFAEANVLPPDKEPPSRDELGLLQRTFRLMVERINVLITENYSSQLLIKETEFKALQAQINPHFLYNTLDSINWMAKVNKQAQISEMVQALAFLLRNSINLKESLLTLEEELEIVKNYITIQKIRFGDRLSFHLELESVDLQRRIPKLTLQPLLENAIHYALEPSIHPCHIAVRGLTDQDLFILVVEDDGPGMDNDTLERLRQNDMQTNGNGIGLLNIDERIKYAFGDQYGITIDSTPGTGTRIQIIIPNEVEESSYVQSSSGR
ncbi:sensor histidine kinase [Paenibacillus lemnae]|uniref:cache domain-containing sensor histidine kinase n=1 Tax=Paenibacillus lemnae TaxID=1330551 RepID=UPI0031B64B04